MWCWLRGYVDRMTLDTFKVWWSGYRDIFAPTENMNSILLTPLVAADGKIAHELCKGDRFGDLTETELLEVAKNMDMQDEVAKEVPASEAAVEKAAEEEAADDI